MSVGENDAKLIAYEYFVHSGTQRVGTEYFVSFRFQENVTKGLSVTMWLSLLATLLPITVKMPGNMREIREKKWLVQFVYLEENGLCWIFATRL